MAKLKDDCLTLDPKETQILADILRELDTSEMSGEEAQLVDDVVLLGDEVGISPE